MRGITYVFSQWLNGNPARVNIKQPWQQVTSVTPCGLRLVCSVMFHIRSTVAGWSQAAHLIVGVLRYSCVSPLGGIRLGTALVRIRRSLHTMLLTNSNSKPVSARWSTVVGWSRTTHLIVGVLRYSCVSPFGGIRLGTAMVRDRRSNHIARVKNFVSHL